MDTLADTGRPDTDHRVTIHDKQFRIYLTEAQIQKRVKELAGELARDLPGNPLLICILKGSYVFTSDLSRALGRPHQVDFMRVKSYNGAKSTGRLEILQDLATDITGRHVVVVEDIIDSGLTMARLVQYLQARGPASLDIATLLRKPDAAMHKLDVRYVGFDIPNDFVVGYGLDYDEDGRGLKHLYVLTA